MLQRWETRDVSHHVHAERRWDRPIRLEGCEGSDCPWLRRRKTARVMLSEVFHGGRAPRLAAGRARALRGDGRCWAAAPARAAPQVGDVEQRRPCSRGTSTWGRGVREPLNLVDGLSQLDWPLRPQDRLIEETRHRSLHAIPPLGKHRLDQSARLPCSLGCVTIHRWLVKELPDRETLAACESLQHRYRSDTREGVEIILLHEVQPQSSYASPAEHVGQAHSTSSPCACLSGMLPCRLGQLDTVPPEQIVQVKEGHPHWPESRFDVLSCKWRRAPPNMKGHQ
mmetsp:Transcript_18279/g.53266  ORF Transcript_18279/g.53266 Transcript_18279/m.53266 type:complete len:282 (-) Transcript_18279:47-892(-)